MRQELIDTLERLRDGGISISTANRIILNMFDDYDKQREETLKSTARELMGSYVSSEGCGCCGNVEKHDKASEKLGELLEADKYEDGSGTNWYKYAK